jgi:hypothetical protein
MATRIRCAEEEDETQRKRGDDRSRRRRGGGEEEEEGLTAAAAGGGGSAAGAAGGAASAAASVRRLASAPDREGECTSAGDEAPTATLGVQQTPKPLLSPVSASPKPPEADETANAAAGKIS